MDTEEIRWKLWILWVRYIALPKVDDGGGK